MKIITPMPITAYFEVANEVSSSVRKNEGPAMRLVLEVDELIRERLFGVDIDLGIHPMNLTLASYYSFLAAVRVAISGQAAGVFPLLRQGLECACYAYRMTEDEQLVDIWLRRHKDAEHEKFCRKSFGSAVSDTSRSIGQKQAELGTLVSELNQASIDFGGHPNLKSVLPHMSLKDLEEHVEVALVCLYDANDRHIQFNLIACAETGIACAFVAALAAKNHPLIDAEYTSLNAIYGRVRETVAALRE